MADRLAEIKAQGWLLGPARIGRFCFVLSRDDLYIGAFWDRIEGVLYVAPLPGAIFGIRLRAPADQGTDHG